MQNSIEASQSYLRTTWKYSFYHSIPTQSIPISISTYNHPSNFKDYNLIVVPKLSMLLINQLPLRVTPYQLSDKRNEFTVIANFAVPLTVHDC